MRGRRRSSPHLDGRELAVIFAGGVAGTLARAGLVKALPHDPGVWPWATFAVNIAGALLLGVVAASQQTLLPRTTRWHAFAATGLCGALTTFSTFQLELLQMLDAGHIVLALGYATASIGCGFAALLTGTHVLRHVRAAV